MASGSAAASINVVALQSWWVCRWMNQLDINQPPKLTAFYGYTGEKLVEYIRCTALALPSPVFVVSQYWLKVKETNVMLPFIVLDNDCTNVVILTCVMLQL